MSSTSERPQAQTTASSSIAAASRPPVEIHPTAHLDPGAYVRGTHAIFLGPGVLVHPRAMLVSVHGPLIINDGTVIMEKCIVGGPVPDAKDTSLPSSSTMLAGVEMENDDPVKTVIGTDVLVMPHAQIHAGATCRDASIVESHATITKSGRLGKHSKVCPGATLASTLGDWEVAFGPANKQRRKRMPIQEAERARLKAMHKDREATITVLRMSARTPILRKK